MHAAPAEGVRGAGRRQCRPALRTPGGAKASHGRDGAAIVMQCNEMMKAADPACGTRARGMLGLTALVLVVYAAQMGWKQHLDTRRGQELAALAAPGDLRMISSDTCPYCVAARRWLREHDVPFSECSIERDPACRADYERAGTPGTPTFIVRGRHVVTGLDQARLRDALKP